MNARMEEKPYEQRKHRNTITDMEMTETRVKMEDEEFMETTTTRTNEQRFVETSRADRLIWLLKCPLMASPMLQTLNRSHSSSSSSPSSHPIVGKVIVSIDPCQPIEDTSDTQFTMNLAGSEADNVPRHYRMDMSHMEVPTSALSVTSQGKASVEGKILNKMDMRPHEDSLATYSKLCRARIRHYKTKVRQIQVINDDKGLHIRPMPGLCLNKKVPTKGSYLRRARKDRGDVEEILFKLFERRPNWTFKQLTQETDQPELYLKEILKTLCDYNCRGDNQGTYTLKAEYRLAKNQATGSEDDDMEEEKKVSLLPSTH